MQIGLLIRYGKLVPGREAQAIELFREAGQYYRDKVAEKVLTRFEPFFFETSDLEEELGFFVLKGPAPEIFRLMEDERYLRLMQKGRSSSSTCAWTCSPSARASSDSWSPR
jgi:hypothetical protein